jgi:two-component system CheB/CheR fusion protein
MEEIQGHFFFDLDIGLPVEQLRIPIRSCQAGTSDYEELELEAVNRRGKTIRCRVICTPLIVEKLRQGIILLMEEGEVLGQ